jgi:cytochrome subunit of sulfide dehydrogenase
MAKPLRNAWVALACMASAASGAQTSADLQTRALAASCAACHGTDGRAVEGAAVPGLAGRPQTLIAAQMKAFQDGSRPATLMHQISKGYSDEQINRIAAYFSRVAP